MLVCHEQPAVVSVRETRGKRSGRLRKPVRKHIIQTRQIEPDFDDSQQREIYAREKKVGIAIETYRPREHQHTLLRECSSWWRRGCEARGATSRLRVGFRRRLRLAVCCRSRRDVCTQPTVATLYWIQGRLGTSYRSIFRSFSYSGHSPKSVRDFLTEQLTC